MASWFGLRRCRVALSHPRTGFLQASCSGAARNALDTSQSMTRSAAPASLLAMAFSLGLLCTPTAVPAATAVLRGQATYRARILPPPNAVLVVTLEDVSRADAPAREIASAQMALKSGPPYAWRMAYDKDAVEGSRQVLRARILVDGKLFMSTDQGHQALGDHAVKVPSLLLQQVQARPVDVLPSTPDASLQGTYWKLTELGGLALPPIAAQAPEAHIVLLAEGRVAGSDGCNRMMGSYTIEAAQLWFERLGGTKIACPTASGTHTAFVRALLIANAWRVTGNTLELMAGREPVARFAAVALQ